MFGDFNVLNQTAGVLHMQGVEVFGSISFNQVAMIYTANGTTAKTLTLSFGLYSLNGSTLSLANSASTSTNPTANGYSWITLGTSATQDITPGNWYFGFISSTSSNNNLSVVCMPGFNYAAAATQRRPSGVFVMGEYSVTTNAFPTAICTSDMIKEPTGKNPQYPYILISA